ncbi:bifunctional copper resistance protein CopD/cytochrome c oxidase assembly protein [Solihabitans fulvus]|uniref:Bifunctional copper resistance protein CopD/cytochrome c oxidase assembly protein n=1 Tax=Solihabitans fulvus TaxID=1892852 RepID=A0A5B2XPF5_9PSEU|nr:bifunctional copper resistance protein CopD/cytochrome c oxidase assembly protein [Solihabitans fulvus]
MTPLLVCGAALAAVLAAALVSLSGSEQYLIYGLPDPGVLTRYGLTAVRVLTEVGAVVCVGSLLFAAFLVPPQPSGRLSPDGYAAIRSAGWAALVWCLGSALSVVFTAADTAGAPVTEVLKPAELLKLIGAVEQCKAWVITTIITLLVLIACRLVLSWGWTATTFFLALFGLVPVAVTGHSSSGGSHDMATNSLLFHLLAAALWVGGLIALLAHGRRRGPHLALATTRFSRLALACWLVMAVSGVINALVRLPLRDLFATTYGLLVVAKIVLLGLLGVIGFLQRQRSVREVVAKGTGRALLKLAGVEVLIMFVTIGVAAALSRTPPPTDAYFTPSPVEQLIGYDLNGPPTVLRMLFDWRFDLLFGTVSIALAVAYLLGVRRLRARGDAWPVGRTISWVCGCLMILLATSSGLGRYSPAMFSAHMGSHMMLSMLAPVLLVLGGPVTLALRALPAAGKQDPPGPREWLLAFVQSPVARVLTNPFVALALFVGSFYGLYFSGLFDSALNYHWAHLAMNAHFILVGYVFYWPVIGIDPAPKRLPPLGRLGLLFASMPFHAFFGIILMSMQTVIGDNFYRSLALPWVTDQLADQRLGGGIAWAAGEIPLLVVVVALLVQWSRSDERDARRADRRADADGDADLVAYNAMLGKLAERGPKK